MSEVVNLQDVRQKLYERLKPSGWADRLKVFLLSEDFDRILKRLYDEASAGKRFTPPLKQVFRAFEECPYKDLKVIIIGQDPYPYPNVADGIAFSCGNDGKVQASLRYMFKEIERTVYPDGYTWDPDLARWSRQGILLLNTALTTNMGEVGRHYDLWQPFIAYLLDILCFNDPGLIYVFMGKKAEAWSKSIPSNNHKLFTTHPAFAAHNNSQSWDSGDVFNKVNDILFKANGLRIEW